MPRLLSNKLFESLKTCLTFEFNYFKSIVLKDNPPRDSYSCSEHTSTPPTYYIVPNEKVQLRQLHQGWKNRKLLN